MCRSDGSFRFRYALYRYLCRWELPSVRYASAGQSEVMNVPKNSCGNVCAASCVMRGSNETDRILVLKSASSACMDVINKRRIEDRQSCASWGFPVHVPTSPLGRCGEVSSFTSPPAGTSTLFQKQTTCLAVGRSLVLYRLYGIGIDTCENECLTSH